MRWFLDTEFNEDGKTIELISIALVSETNEAYYAESADFDSAACNSWVREHVLPQLGPPQCRDPRTQIRDEVSALLLRDGKPEVWGYFADYDWVVLCQLYGRMIDLPKGFPYYCHDLKQLMHERGIEKSHLPPQRPMSYARPDGQICTYGEHHALSDAQWIRDAWLWIQAKR